VPLCPLIPAKSPKSFFFWGFRVLGFRFKVPERRGTQNPVPNPKKTNELVAEQRVTKARSTHAHARTQKE
jgi:hypothetical protein